MKLLSENTTILTLKKLDQLERIFVVLSLLLYMQVLIPLFITQGANEGDGIDPTSFDYTFQNMLYIANYLIVSTLLFLRWQRVLAVVLSNIGLFLLLSIAPLSWLWSARPDSTFTASVGILGTTFFALYLSSRFNLNEIIRLIGWAYGVSLALSIALIILLPDYGIMSGVHEGALRGVWTHKNTMGGSLIVGNYVFLILAIKSRMKNIFLVSCLAVSIAMTIGTQSTNSMLNSFFAVLLVLALNHIFRYHSLKSISIILVFMAAVCWSVFIWFSDISAWAFGSLGKDPTLTGRTDIWMTVIDKIQERPWLGYGFSGFWHGIHGESAYVVRALRWPVPNSHNGYLDLVLQVGLIGLIIFVIVYFIAFVKAFFLAQDNSDMTEYIFPFVYLFFIPPTNIAEPSILVQNNISWVLFAALVAVVNNEFKQKYLHPSA